MPIYMLYVYIHILYTISFVLLFTFPCLNEAHVYGAATMVKKQKNKYASLIELKRQYLNVVFVLNGTFSY